MVIVIAIALAVACAHHSVQKENSQKQLPVKKSSIPYVPAAFRDMSLFPGNVFEFVINYL